MSTYQCYIFNAFKAFFFFLFFFKKKLVGYKFKKSGKTDVVE